MKILKQERLEIDLCALQWLDFFWKRLLQISLQPWICQMWDSILPICCYSMKGWFIVSHLPTLLHSTINTTLKNLQKKVMLGKKSPEITGQTQVWYSDVPMLVQKDVGRLQVSINNVTSEMKKCHQNSLSNYNLPMHVL